MNKGLNIFLAVLLCVVVYIGLLLSFYSSKNVEASNPYLGDVKSTRGTYGTYAVSANSMGSNMATISVRSANSIFHHRPVFSYAPAASMPTYSQSPIGGTLSKSVASPIYTTSSAEFHSFGGSNTGGVSMSSGVVSTNSQSPISNRHLAMNPLPSSTALSQSNSSMLVLAQSSLQEIGATSVSSPNAPRGINGRRNAMGWGDGAEDWLNGIIGEGTGNGWMYENGGINYFDEAKLYELYLAAIANGDLPEGVSWEMFKQWFLRPNSGYSFPIPTGVLFMCILALGYGLYIAYRRKQKVVNS